MDRHPSAALASRSHGLANPAASPAISASPLSISPNSTTTTPLPKQLATVATTNTPTSATTTTTTASTTNTTGTSPSTTNTHGTSPSTTSLPPTSSSSSRRINPPPPPTSSRNQSTPPVPPVPLNMRSNTPALTLSTVTTTPAKVVQLVTEAMEAALKESKLQASDAAGASGVVVVESDLKPGVTIDLSRNGIRELPDEVVDIIKNELERLALSHNFLTSFPARFAECSSLRYLNVRSNQIKDFPLALCNLKSLEILDLGRNKLRQLPNELVKLTSLKVLAVQKNRIRELPLCLSEMSSLQVLKIDGNDIVFPPPEILSIQAIAPPTEGVLRESELNEIAVTTHIKKFLKQRAKLARAVTATSSGTTTSTTTTNADGQSEPTTGVGGSNHSSHNSYASSTSTSTTSSSSHHANTPSLSTISSPGAGGGGAGDDASDTPETPRPQVLKRAMSGRFPVKVQGTEMSPNLSRPPPIPTRSHHRELSQQGSKGATTNKVLPLTIGNMSERSRNPSDGSQAATPRLERVDVRTRRGGTIVKNRSELSTLDEGHANNRFSNHYRGLSHGSAIQGAAVTVPPSPTSSTSAEPAYMQRPVYIRRLSVLPERKQDTGQTDPVIEAAKGILYSIFQIHPTVQMLMSLTSHTSTKRSSLELVCYNISTHLEELEQAIQKHHQPRPPPRYDEDDHDESQDGDEEKRDARTAAPEEEAAPLETESVLRACQTLVVAYTHVCSLLMDNVDTFVESADPRYLRTLMMLLYNSIMEIRATLSSMPISSSTPPSIVSTHTSAMSPQPAVSLSATAHRAMSPQPGLGSTIRPYYYYPPRHQRSNQGSSATSRGSASPIPQPSTANSSTPASSARGARTPSPTHPHSGGKLQPLMTPELPFGGTNSESLLTPTVNNPNAHYHLMDDRGNRSRPSSPSLETPTSSSSLSARPRPNPIQPQASSGGQLGFTNANHSNESLNNNNSNNNSNGSHGLRLKVSTDVMPVSFRPGHMANQDGHVPPALEPTTPPSAVISSSVLDSLPADDQGAFENMVHSIQRATDLVQQTLPAILTQLNSGLERSVSSSEPHQHSQQAPIFQNVIAKATLVMQFKEALALKIASTAGRDDVVPLRKQTAFWNVCNNFFDSWTDFGNELRDNVKKLSLPADELSRLRPIHYGIRDAVEYWSRSPYSLFLRASRPREDGGGTHSSHPSSSSGTMNSSMNTISMGGSMTSHDTPSSAHSSSSVSSTLVKSNKPTFGTSNHNHHHHQNGPADQQYPYYYPPNSSQQSYHGTPSSSGSLSAFPYNVREHPRYGILSPEPGTPGPSSVMHGSSHSSSSTLGGGPGPTMTPQSGSSNGSFHTTNPGNFPNMQHPPAAPSLGRSMTGPAAGGFGYLHGNSHSAGGYYDGSGPGPVVNSGGGGGGGGGSGFRSVASPISNIVSPKSAMSMGSAGGGGISSLNMRSMASPTSTPTPTSSSSTTSFSNNGMVGGHPHANSSFVSIHNAGGSTNATPNGSIPMAIPPPGIASGRSTPTPGMGSLSSSPATMTPSSMGGGKVGF